MQGLGQDRAPPSSIYCSGPFRALGQRRWRGCDSVFINQRRLTWPEANKEAIGRGRSLRKKRSRQSPPPQAKRARRRDGSRTSRPARKNRNWSRNLTTRMWHLLQVPQMGQTWRSLLARQRRCTLKSGRRQTWQQEGLTVGQSGPRPSPQSLAARLCRSCQPR